MSGFALLSQADQPGGAAPKVQNASAFCHHPRSISGKMKD